MQRQDKITPQLAGDALVNDSGVHITIAQNHMPAREGRPNDFSGMLHAVRHVEQQFGPGIEVAVDGIQQDGPQPPPEWGAAGLAGYRTGLAMGLQEGHQMR